MSENSDFGTFGRYRELPIEKMTVDQKRAYEFTMKERGQSAWAVQDLSAQS